MLLCLRITVLIAGINLNYGFAFAEDGGFAANDLMAGCRAYLANDIPTENYFAAKYCAGIIDELVGAEQGICLPASSTQQAARVVVKYIDARPARLRESFQKLAREALRAAFPCKH